MSCNTIQCLVILEENIAKDKTLKNNKIRVYISTS